MPLNLVFLRGKNQSHIIRHVSQPEIHVISNITLTPTQNIQTFKHQKITYIAFAVLYIPHIGDTSALCKASQIIRRISWVPISSPKCVALVALSSADISSALVKKICQVKIIIRTLLYYQCEG